MFLFFLSLPSLCFIIYTRITIHTYRVDVLWRKLKKMHTKKKKTKNIECQLVCYPHWNWPASSTYVVMWENMLNARLFKILRIGCYVLCSRVICRDCNLFFCTFCITSKIERVSCSLSHWQRTFFIGNKCDLIFLFWNGFSLSLRVLSCANRVWWKSVLRTDFQFS